MYKEKRLFLQKKILEDRAFQGITVQRLDKSGAPIGTPCIATHDRLNVIVDQKNKIIMDTRSLSPARYVPSNGMSSGSTRGQSHKTVTMCVREIAENLGDVNLFKKFLYDNVGNLNIVLPFATSKSQTGEYATYTAPIQHIHPSGKKPLIYDDNFLSMEARSLSDIHTPEELNNLDQHILTNLNKYRYINYILRDVGMSIIKDMIHTFQTVIGNLSSNYNSCVSIHNPRIERIMVLVDTISLSFYRLDDVIAVFDCKGASKGFGVEIFLTNSALSPSLCMEASNKLVYISVFSRSRENIFTIDGEKIARPNDSSIGGTLKSLCKSLKMEVPDDKALIAEDKTEEKPKSKTTKDSKKMKEKAAGAVIDQ